MNLPPLADACPRCHPFAHEAIVPHAVLADPDGSLRASYACPVCGARWSTGWDRSAWPVFTVREPEPVAPLIDGLIAALADLLAGVRLGELDPAAAEPDAA